MYNREGLPGSVICMLDAMLSTFPNGSIEQRALDIIIQLTLCDVVPSKHIFKAYYGLHSIPFNQQAFDNFAANYFNPQQYTSDQSRAIMQVAYNVLDEYVAHHKNPLPLFENLSL